MTSMPTRPADNWKITTKNTAVIVVDMQNIWMRPRGTRYLPMSEDIVPKIQELNVLNQDCRLQVYSSLKGSV